MTRSLLAPVLAFAALLTGEAAAAQTQACVAPADLGDGVVYAMPIAYEAVRSACANRLARDGFISARGEGFITPFRARQDAAWPGAFRLLKTFMASDPKNAGNGGPDMLAMLSSMPEDALRPFVDAMIGQVIAEEIKGDDCSRIERGVELISPLPIENVGGLVAFIAEMADLNNPSICPTAAGAPRK